MMVITDNTTKGKPVDPEMGYKQQLSQLFG